MQDRTTDQTTESPETLLLEQGLDKLRCQLTRGESLADFNLLAASWLQRFSHHGKAYLDSQLLKVITFDWLQKRAVETIFRAECNLAEAESDRESPERGPAIYAFLERMIKRQTWYEKSFAAAFRTLQAITKQELLEAQIRRQRHAPTYFGERESA